MRADAPDLNPVDRRQSGDAFAAVSCPALRIALREVSAEWAEADRFTSAWGN